MLGDFPPLMRPLGLAIWSGLPLLGGDSRLLAREEEEEEAPEIDLYINEEQIRDSYIHVYRQLWEKFPGFGIAELKGAPGSHPPLPPQSELHTILVYNLTRTAIYIIHVNYT